MKMKIIIFTTVLLISNVFAEGIIPNKSGEIIGIQEKVIISFLVLLWQIKVITRFWDPQVNFLRL